MRAPLVLWSCKTGIFFLFQFNSDIIQEQKKTNKKTERDSEILKLF